MFKPIFMVRGVRTFGGTYEKYKNEIQKYGGKSWNEDTVEQYDRIVANHIIPYLENHNNRPISDYTKKDYENALNRFIKRGQGKPGEPFEPWEESTIQKIAYLMRAVVWAASNHNLCVNVFEQTEEAQADSVVAKRSDSTASRIPKSLTALQEMRVFTYLMENRHKIGSVAGLLMMFVAGLRNNEACGINFGYIDEFTEYPGHYYLIIPQTTDLGKNSVDIRGKTNNCHRRIPISTFIAKVMFSLMELRYHQAKKKGYTGEALDLPVACRKGMPNVRCDSEDLSYAAKEMFVKIGMREDEIVELNEDLLRSAQIADDELEDDFKEIEKDPTAYLLRRNFATHLKELGLHSHEIQYVIGHKIEELWIKRRDFTDESLLYPIAEKLAERPILNLIEEEKVVAPTLKKTVTLSSSKKIRICIPVERFKDVEIKMTAREPGDEIKITVRRELDRGEVACDCRVFSTPWKGKNKETIDVLRKYHKKYMDAGANELFKKYAMQYGMGFATQEQR